MAKTVLISLRQQGTVLELVIKDDGIGFDPSKKREGVGLQNIVSRAELYNGKVHIYSEPGIGCELVITFTTNYEMASIKTEMRV